MKIKKILIVVGTRPNFIKVTQFKKEVEKYESLELKIVHTGQHYDKAMSDVFFNQFNLFPDYFLKADNSSIINQMTSIMTKLEELILKTYKPDLMIVPGDVNSTLASALVANKLNIKLAHLESGLRSFDKKMPEEHNRILTDHLSDYLFVTEQSGLNNLKDEKVKGKEFFVGNTMIDTMVAFKDEIRQSNILQELKILKEFILVTMHRPSNVDDLNGINKLIQLLTKLSLKYQIVFPIHPRTLKQVKEFGLFQKIDTENIILTEAIGYFEFQKLIENCSFILTDSGGIQEESTFKKIPCLTLRDNTERPITIHQGSNKLIPFNVDVILNEIDLIENNKNKNYSIPDKWDGKTTQRIVELIANEILVDEK